MFESKLNYMTAGMVLGLLILVGRFAWMQVISFDRHAAQAGQMRTSMTLLDPQRADIVLADGRPVAQTESVWDIYLDLERFADPRGMAQRAHRSPARYDAEAVARFTTTRLQPVLDMPLSNPSGRRRFFLLWGLRAEPESRHDFEVCASRLCLITGIPREEFDARVAMVAGEVDALAAALGNPAQATEREVSAAWLRARPALNDTEYWKRIIRFPRSISLAPVLELRLQWLEREAETLQGLLEHAGDDAARLRDLCFQAMRNARARADDLSAAAPDEPGEEHDAWMRISDTCARVVRGESRALALELEALRGPGGRIAATRERLARLRANVLERYGADWQARWSRLGISESPLLLLRDAPREVVEMLKVNADVLPGITCLRRPARRYSHARELAHVLGTVGMPDAERLDAMASRPGFGAGLEDFIDDWFQGDREAFCRRFEAGLSQQLSGVSGIERAWDERLAGRHGARVSVRDAAGRVRGMEFERAPENADPLRLGIDLELQRDILENARKWEPELARIAADKSAQRVNRGLAEVDRWQQQDWSLRGAAVVLDVRTGAILALCSFPDYDPELLSGRSPEALAYQRQLELEQELEKSAGTPWWNQKARMFNRATQGLYAPGSTFKVLTSIAMLESGAVTPGTTFTEDGPRIYHNGKLLGRTAHPVYGTVDAISAIERSCNGYFYRWSQELGPGPQSAWENMRAYAEMFGVGAALDSDLGAVRRARLPEPHRVWAQNLAMLAIGQGEMATTPLEVARMYAAIANRGTLLTPHLCDEAGSWPEQLEISDSTWDTVHAGMRQVVFGRNGTANKYDVLKRIRCAGKTGTSENGAGVPDHAWFAGFAPHDDPQVAFVFLAANSDLYGGEVAALIGECIERHFQRHGILPAPRD